MSGLVRRLCYMLIASLLSASALASSAAELDAHVHETLDRLYEKSTAAQSLSKNAKAILVFPKILKAGIVVGGEYGQGALLLDNQITGYYNTVSASVGFQFGGQVRSQVLMFMTDEALKGFKESNGWEVGVDGSVAVVEFGVGESISSNTYQAPVIGFVSDNKGLMYNLTLEGTKITPIKK